MLLGVIVVVLASGTIGDLAQQSAASQVGRATDPMRPSATIIGGEGVETKGEDGGLAVDGGGS